MNVMALDLELNQPSGSIIQVGITIGDVNSGAVLEKQGWITYIPEVINPYITKLTTITQEQVDAGILLVEAYKQMVALYKKHNCTLNFVTWGGGDHRELKRQLYEQKELLMPDEALMWEFGHREFDTKTIFLAFALADNKKVRSGLAKSMTRVGMAFKGTKHTAPDDAENTFLLLVHLLKNLPKGVLSK